MTRSASRNTRKKGFVFAFASCASWGTPALLANALIKSRTDPGGIDVCRFGTS